MQSALSLIKTLLRDLKLRPVTPNLFQKLGHQRWHIQLPEELKRDIVFHCFLAVQAKSWKAEKQLAKAVDFLWIKRLGIVTQVAVDFSLQPSDLFFVFEFGRICGNTMNSNFK